MAVLPFRWSAVDAFYYMETFSGLRKMKGETSTPLSPDVLLQRFIEQIDQAVEEGGYLSLLFHPFLSNVSGRMAVFEKVLQHLAKRRDEGQIWLTRCRDVSDWIKEHPQKERASVLKNTVFGFHD